MSEKPEAESGAESRREDTVGRDPGALRQELRRLGYLANPMERFLIGDLSRPASPLVTSLVVGLKVGVLSGVLIGGLLLVGFLLSHRELASAFADAAVVSAYVLGMAVAGLSLASILVGLLLHLAARVSRRAVPLVELVATSGAVVAGGAIFIYLALWWRVSRRELGMVELGWADAAAAAGALLVCGVLAMALRAGGRALLVRVERVTPSPVRRAPLWRRAILLGLGAVLFFLVGYVGMYGTADAPEPVDFHTKYAGARLYLVAIDGLSYERVRRRLDEDPGAWLGRQAHIAPLSFPDSVNTATLWTTVATGLPPELHGVESFETTRIAGLAHYVPLRTGGPGLEEALRVMLPFFGFARRVPISSISLSARPLWDIFSEKGLRVAAVNWWATWPAQEVRGVVVSDRTFTKLDFAQQKEVGEPAFEGETYPEAAFSLAKEVWQGLKVERPSGEPDPVGLAMDRFHQAVVLELLKRAGMEPWPQDYDFVCVYLPGLDIAHHGLLQASQQLSSSQLESALQAVHQEVRHLDGWLADLAREAARREATVLVVGLPARRDRGAGAQGFCALWGPDAGAVDLPPMHLYDLAPTVLAMMGFPVSEEMPGHAHLELFSSERVPTGVDTLVSYGPRRPGLGAAGSVIDEEYRLRLHSLGYID